MRQTLLLAAAIALGLAACDETNQAGGESLTGTEWVAETINGKPVIELGGVTLAFADERVTGRSGCNRYFGAAEHKNGTLKITQVGATKMACLRDGLMQQESAYLSALQNAGRYAVSAEGRLAITGPSGIDLRFVAGPGQQTPE